MINRSMGGGLTNAMIDYLTGRKPHEILYPGEEYQKEIQSPHTVKEYIDAATPLGEAAAVSPFLKQLTHSLGQLYNPEIMHSMEGAAKGGTELAEAEGNNFVEFINKLYENLFKSKSEGKHEKEKSKIDYKNLSERMTPYPDIYSL